MSCIADELAARVMRFAVRVVRFCRALPTEATVAVLAKQLLRSATSASANYRAARRGRSRAEFIAKLGLVVEEADETMHWLEMIRDANLLDDRAALEELANLLEEGRELRAIFVRSVSTARMNQMRRS